LARMSTRLPGAKYKDVFAGGRSLRGRLMSAWVFDLPDAGGKAGVVVSKKTFHDAVDRNRTKRIMREGFRLASVGFSHSAAWVLVGRASLRGKRTQDVVDELRYLARKGGALCERS